MARKHDYSKVIDTYMRLGNIWRVAEEIGVPGQTVHRILVTSGIDRNRRYACHQEKKEMRSLYKDGFLRGDGKLQAHCHKWNRCKSFVSGWAKKNGLETSYNRKSCQRLKDENGIRKKKEWEKNGHPRGMLGKKHSNEHKALQSKLSKARAMEWKKTGKQSEITLKIMKTRERNGTLVQPRSKCSWKQAWHTVGGKRFFARSSWEYEYAKILNIRKNVGIICDWEHEPDIFWFENIKRGVRCYKPDFKVTYQDGSFEYHEVKGWMDAKSKTKLKRMAKYYPEVKVVLIDAKAYKAVLSAGI